MARLLLRYRDEPQMVGGVKRSIVGLAEDLLQRLSTKSITATVHVLYRR